MARPHPPPGTGAAVQRRVVVTGLNLVTSLGLDLESTWQGLLDGRSGVRPISLFDASGCQTRIAAELPEDFKLLAQQQCSRRLERQMARATKIGYVCAKTMVTAAGLDFSRLDRERCATVFGTVDTGHSRIHDNQYWVIKTMPHAVAAWLAVEYGLEGRNVTISAACASGAFAIGDAYDLIRAGRADLVLTGGTSAIINPEHVAGFNEVGALSCANDDPAGASRPFSRGRDGFVIGEGAGTLVLEALESARARGATIYAELLGYASTSECYNIIAPTPQGAGMVKTMRRALQDARVDPDQVDYINAHGTSTALNDKYETLAIKEVFGKRAADIPVSASKSMLGHTAAACGSIEAVVTIMSLRHGRIHPTINYQPDPELDLDYVPNSARIRPLRIAISNSFGFGGCNACLVFGRFAD